MSRKSYVEKKDVDVIIMQKSKIKLLVIGPSLNSRGGVATVERQLMGSIPDDSVEASFIATYDDGCKLKKAALAAIAYWRFVVSLNSCNLVHVHMAAYASYWRKRFFINAAFKRGIPVVLHLHSGKFAKWYEDECDDSQRASIRSTFHQCSAAVVLSEEWRDYLLSKGICDSGKLHVVHNAVLLPEEPCSPCSHQDILFLGRLDANKSPDVLLRASRKALEIHPKAKLIFGGDGCPERYRRLANELGIADRCEFLGWVSGDDKEKLFEIAGVYCLPSKHEGMPMSVLEAMAHGIPTIATPVGGVPQIIDNGVDGFIVPVDDEVTMSRILVQLLDSAELRAKIGSAGRVKIGNEFDIRKNVGKLVGLYEELLSKNTSKVSS